MNRLRLYIRALELIPEFVKGGKIATPMRQLIGRDYTKMTDELFRLGVEAGVLEEGNKRKTYIPHLYEDKIWVDGQYVDALDILRPGEEGFLMPKGFARFHPKTARRRTRGYKGGLLEALEKGHELTYPELTANLEAARTQVLNSIADSTLLDLGMQSGIVTPIPRKGYVKLEHPLAKFGKAELFAAPHFATMFNNVTKQSWVRSHPFGEKLMQIHSMLKMNKIVGGNFHLTAFIRGAVLGGPFKLGKMLKPWEIKKEGWSAIMNAEPRLMKLIKQHNATLFRIQDFDPAMAGRKTVFGEWLDNKAEGTLIAEFGRPVWNTLLGLRDRYQNFLFGRLGSSLKAATMLRELDHSLAYNADKLASGEMNENEIYDSVAQLGNNDFGGLPYEAMGRSNTARDIMSLMWLGPDWTESNVRSMLAMIKGGEEGRVHRNFWARIGIKTGVVVLLMNFLMAGFDDEDSIERFKKAWGNGGLKMLSVDVTPTYKLFGGDKEVSKYISVGGHYEDMLKFVTHPWRSAYHKSGILTKPVLNAFRGTNWQGKPYTGITEFGELGSASWESEKTGWPVLFDPSTALSWFAESFKHTTIPITGENLMNFLSGQAEGWDTFFNVAGFQSSTSFQGQNNDNADEYDSDSQEPRKY
jgi:hypothetical protein